MNEFFLKQIIDGTWNALIPKCARQVEATDKGVSYLHPTKGRRFISSRRFRAQAAMRGVRLA